MNIERYIENLKREYGGKNLPDDIKKEAIEIYKRSIPNYFKFEGDICPIVTFSYVLLAEGYNKIVFRDYGLFLYVEESMICWDNFVPKPVQIRNDIVLYEIDNYPNFECIYVKYNEETSDEAYMLIPVSKTFPVQKV